MKKSPLYPHQILDKNTNPTHTGKWCCYYDCDAEGIHPAPKPRPYIKERYWFCLEHIRRYNASWNYFSGMSEDEVENYQRSAVSGHRPTWILGTGPSIATEKILNKVFTMFDGGGSESATPSPPLIPVTEREALIVLDLTYPVTLKEIKARYKKLVKLYHPDVNKNDTQAQEKFIAVNKAYTTLLHCGYFLP